MRKILLFILILSLLFVITGCNNTLPDDSFNEDSVNETTANESNIIMDLQIFETDLCDIDLVPIFPVELEDVLSEPKPINTDETAVEVGTTIISNLHKQGSFPDYILVGVVHSTADNIWRFEYSIDYRTSIAASLTESGCLYVAINGDDGSLLTAWVEEG